MGLSDPGSGQDQIKRYLGEDGLVARNIQGYEMRSGQIAMAEQVLGMFSHDQIAVAEGETGIGKSFAYLIPSMIWLSEHGDERIVVATSTMNLQHQLVDKDLPFITRVAEDDVRYCLLKGRTNYVCLRRLTNETSDMELFKAGDATEIGRIMRWVETSETGMRSEYPEQISSRIWRAVCSEPDLCENQRCSFFGSCFVMHSRKEALESRILVVNHHLLLADIVMRIDEEIPADETAVLPPYDRIIIDEAHNIEKNSTGFFTRSYNERALDSVLMDLIDAFGSLLGGRRVRLFMGGRKARGRAMTHPLVERLMELRTLVTSYSEEFHGSLLELGTLGVQSDHDREQDVFQVLLDEGLRGTPEFAKVRLYAGQVLKALDDIGLVVKGIMDDTADSGNETIYYLRADAAAYVRRMRRIQRLIDEAIVQDPSSASIGWIERGYVSDAEDQQRRLELHLTPLTTAPLLCEHLFGPTKSVLCTSATLTVAESFEFFYRQVGLDSLKREQGEDRVTQARYRSPFEFDKNMFLSVPHDAPEPTARPVRGGSDPYESYVFQMTRDLIIAAEGGVLILFTSYALMRRVFESLMSDGLPDSIELLYQGMDDRARLLDRFIKERHSVLLATDSFWEGVDAPGDTLRLLVITRLPFKVPTHPVLVARYRAVEAVGGNPFSVLTLPETAMRLRQGVGRLIRKQSDRGGVIILDSRIITKWYGKTLIRSMPTSKVFVSSSERVIESLEDFLYANKPLL